LPHFYEHGIDREQIGFATLGMGFGASHPDRPHTTATVHAYEGYKLGNDPAIPSNWSIYALIVCPQSLFVTQSVPWGTSRPLNIHYTLGYWVPENWTIGNFPQNIYGVAV
jgi:hypothetical protein